MIRLHLGVIDIAYGQAHRTVSVATETTGDVAGWLEDKYHILEVFFEDNRQFIADQLAQTMADQIADVASGAPPAANPLMDAEHELEKRFKLFLSSGEIESFGIPGVPTKAALKGVNHRKKHPYSRKNARRPSFIDTGLYQSSFKVWVD